MFNLQRLGWNEFFENQFIKYKEKNFIAARIAAENKQRYTLFSEYGELNGEVTGKLLYASETNAELPKIGDWIVGVLFEKENKIIIHAVLERKTKISRKVPDRKTEEQLIAANIDLAFIVQSLDRNYSIRRLERYITTVFESKAEPVIILNKVDLNDQHDKFEAEVKKIFPEINIILTNALVGRGIYHIQNLLKDGVTAVFIGSSGVGKSTIINSLLEKNVLKTLEISKAVQKGKHATTRREMLLIPGGGIVIDTPGMRELQLWNSDEGLNSVYQEIESLALQCKFSDCTHTKEKGCAIIDAVKNGWLDEEKMKGYQKLQKELNYLEEKQDKYGFLKRKEREKKLHKEIKNYYKLKKFK